MTDEQKTFIDSLVKPAQASEIKYGVLTSITIAQAILESGWGKSDLATEANNLFGIKASGNFVNDENSVLIRTTEYNEDGSEYETEARFWRYPSVKASVKAHGEFLTKPRYDRVRAADTVPEQARELQKAGYATAPNYADYLIRLIEQYDLDQYDRPTFCPECGARIRKCRVCGYLQHEVSM